MFSVKVMYLKPSTLTKPESRFLKSFSKVTKVGRINDYNVRFRAFQRHCKRLNQRRALKKNDYRAAKTLDKGNERDEMNEN